MCDSDFPFAGENLIRVLFTQVVDPQVTARLSPLGITVSMKPYSRIIASKDPSLKDSLHKLFRIQKAVLALTSRNAAECLAQSFQSDIPVPTIPWWEIYCLEGATRAALANWPGNQFIHNYTRYAEDLGKQIVQANPLPKTIHFICGKPHRKELPNILYSAGINVIKYELYETIPVYHKEETIYDGIVFFSPGAVESFFFNNQINQKSICFAIGKTTANRVADYTNNPVIISPFSSPDSLVSVIIDHFLHLEHEHLPIKE